MAPAPACSAGADGRSLRSEPGRGFAAAPPAPACGRGTRRSFPAPDGWRRRRETSRRKRSPVARSITLPLLACLFLERAERIGAQQLGPQIAVVAGRIAAGENVAEAVREALPCRRMQHGDLLAHLLQHRQRARALRPGRIPGAGGNRTARTPAGAPGTARRGNAARPASARTVRRAAARRSGSGLANRSSACRFQPKFSMNWLGSSTASHSTPSMPPIDGSVISVSR